MKKRIQKWLGIKELGYKVAFLERGYKDTVPIDTIDKIESRLRKIEQEVIKPKFQLGDRVKVSLGDTATIVGFYSKVYPYSYAVTYDNGDSSICKESQLTKQDNDPKL